MPPTADSAPGSSLGLPAWVYRHPEMFRRECAEILARAWQPVCHVSQIAQPGEYCRLDFLGAPLVVVRGEQGEVRGFHNVCRHRGARLLDGDGPGGLGRVADGHLRCPYHAWAYGLDGRLEALPARDQYPGLDVAAHGLRPVATEVWRGFVFVRLVDEGPSVKAQFAPWEARIEPYRWESLQPLGRVTLRERRVNWKLLVENYVDTLHVGVAHPGLRRLTGQRYRLEAAGDVLHLHAGIRAGPGASPSEELYCRTLPAMPHLSGEESSDWRYYLLWPNVAFDNYPEQVDFMQMIPISPDRTLIREIAFGLPDERRETRLARYLNWRINRRVNAEDRNLVERTHAGLGGGSFVRGPVAAGEIGLSMLARRIVEAIPEAAGDMPPAAWGRTDTP